MQHIPKEIFFGFIAIRILNHAVCDAMSGDIGEAEFFRKSHQRQPEIEETGRRNVQSGVIEVSDYVVDDALQRRVESASICDLIAPKISRTMTSGFSPSGGSITSSKSAAPESNTNNVSFMGALLQ